MITRLDPMEDGVTHINIYSRARTRLGRLASNHSPIPISHPVFGHFSCAEALWYWLKTGKCREELRVLQARAVRFVGKELEGVHYDDFRKDFTSGLLCKLQDSPELQKLLEESELPFVHYYYFGKPDDANVVVPQGHEWQMAIWTYWRECLKQDLPLIVPTHLL